MGRNSRRHILRNNFVSGQVSRSIASRTEIPLREHAVTESVNTVHFPQGGVRKRPGAKLVFPADMPGLDDHTTSTTLRVFPWSPSADENLYVTIERSSILETNQAGVQTTRERTLRMCVGGDSLEDATLVSGDLEDLFDVAAATGRYRVHRFGFNESQMFQARKDGEFDFLWGINSFQYGENVIFTSDLFPPLILERSWDTDHYDYSLSVMEIVNPPTEFLGDDSDKYEEYTQDSEGNNLNLNNVPFMNEDKFFYWNGSTKGGILVFDEDGLAFQESSSDVPVRPGRHVMQWNESWGWPTLCGIWNGRLYFAASPKYRNRIWFSKVNDFNNFISETYQLNLEATTEDESDLPEVKADFATHRDMDTFDWITEIRPDSDLLVFTKEGEWAVTGTVSADDLTTLQSQRYGHYGCRFAVRTGAIDSHVFYGSTNSAHALIYSGQIRGYRIIDVNADRDETLFDSDDKRIVRVASAQTRNENGVNQVFFLRQDGKICVYHSNAQQEFAAWSVWDFEKGLSSRERHNAGNAVGKIFDLCISNDELVVSSITGVYKLDAGKLSDDVQYLTNPRTGSDRGIFRAVWDKREASIEARLRTCDLTSQFIRIPPEGHVAVKKLEDVHLTCLEAGEGLKVRVFAPQNPLQPMQEIAVPLRIFDETDPVEDLPFGKRVIRCGIADLFASQDTQGELFVEIAHVSGDPFHILRMDYSVELEGG